MEGPLLSFFFRLSSDLVQALEALQALTIDENADAFATPAQLGGDLITLTLLPRARWQTLLKLDVIQVRLSPVGVYLRY